MFTRRSWWTFLFMTAVLLGGVLLLASQRSGQLTIFGDASALGARVTVAGETDLEKGVRAGDGLLTVRNGAIEIRDLASARSGTAQFDIGNPELTEFQHFRVVAATALEPNTSIALQFASSRDGIAFESLSHPITLTQAVFEDGLDLRTVVPASSHYLRVLFKLTALGTETTPRLDGFSIDYEILGEASAGSPLNISADSPPDIRSTTAVTINGTLTGTTEAGLGNQQRKEATKWLAGTGSDLRIIWLVGLWITTALAIWRMSTRPVQQ
ncbi:hypothetical protein HY524_00505 [Candidatus Berkelbacteria bacterium]|nr:hypothetical protein [Candidatus Berkelbacteria bacterium]